MIITTNFLLLLACCTMVPVIILMIYFVAKIINIGTRYIINSIETLYYELQNKQIN